MSDIVITTLNARYIHSAFGLRYLYANMGELQQHTALVEFGIQQRPLEIVEKLLELQPRIIGFGVYIWNAAEIGAIVAILKQVAPQIVVVLGGPEVSHPPDLAPWTKLADFIVTGYGEISFPDLCRQLLVGIQPPAKIVVGQTVPLADLASPYPYYSDTDIRQRIVYVEASRGCPFKCEFCLSSLDLTAKPFALDAFLTSMAELHRRGARNFKFIDRTFNLKTDTSVAILEFFLERLSSDLYLHFEVIPDNLPDRLKTAIARFPPGVLQFEIGVQSFDPAIQQRISRRQDNEKTKANLAWLRQHSQAHIHADLIAGLPGDTLAGFGNSFDALVALQPQEIQVGILKRLRGAPINRHTRAFDLRYDPNPPYALLSSSTLSFAEMQRINRFARFWDLIGNSGRFAHTLPLILADRPFARFMQLSESLYALSGSTWQISLKRLFELVYQAMAESLAIDQASALASLHQDLRLSGEKAVPQFLAASAAPASPKRSAANKRQKQSLQAE
ncbi:B12-binding domain-containing radical SAM protein [Methylomonas koyamae]|uniref:B12-binding domain-containing radical SAM protein n=1 Tax=Methylomonas koyamae TaxID=702114 RepID=UPI0006D21E1F|nr:B12-binding domain-containing radical SAM protein [Methylomonas koyamae]BBL57097.1 B12-binding domain-containing radical SAM protein [Methylomonas koyamae]